MRKVGSLTGRPGKPAALLLALTALAVLFSGCAPSGQKKPEGKKARPQAVVKAQEGGDLVYAMLEEPDNLIPYTTSMSFALNLANVFFDGLTKVNDRFQVVPWLAVQAPTLENGGVSKDGKTITYRLRQGVKWHDGEKFTSADVKATWEWIMDPRNTLVTSRAGYEKIRSVETPDDYTVVFKLREIYAPFVDTLFQAAILPAHVIGKEPDPGRSSLLRKPLGTGPYQFVSWRPNESIIAQKNRGYFLGRPHLDRLIFKSVPDESTVLNQLRSGELDAWEMVNPSLLERVDALPGMRVLRTPSVVWENYAFNHSDNGNPAKPHPILGDKRVRLALWLGTDRKKIVEKLYPGEWQDIAVTDQFPRSWAYNVSLKPVPYDPERAKRLLEEAGWRDINGDGIRENGKRPLVLTISTFSGKKDREQKQVMLQEMWQEIGVEVKIRNYERSLFFGSTTEGGIIASGRYDVAIYAWVAGVDPDDSALWAGSQIPTVTKPGGQNTYFYKNAEIDRLVRDSLGTVDKEKRKSMYRRVQEILYQDAATIFERYWMNLDAVRANVHEFHPNPTNQGNLWNVYQLWKERKTK